MHKTILAISTSILLTACGGGSTDDLEYQDFQDNIYQPDPGKPIGNDGSGVIYQYDPVAPINQPNMTIPPSVLSLPANRRI